MTSSTLSWLAFDDGEAKAARELIKALQTPGSQDALGLGQYRDRLADLMFPGTSTLHTRIRYFLFIPWILQSAAAAATDPADFDQRVRAGEDALMQALARGPHRDLPGIIGLRAGTELRQRPTSSYWKGLGLWGIRGPHHLRPHDVFEAARSDSLAAAWPDLPPPPAPAEPFPPAAPAEIALLPTSEEADFLLEKISEIRAHTEFTDTPTPAICVLADLLTQQDRHAAAMVEHTEKVETVHSSPIRGFLKDLQHLADAGHNVPESTVELTWFAADLSLLMHGAQLRYNILLYQRRDQPHPEWEKLEEKVDRWAEQIAQEQIDQADWPRRLKEYTGLLSRHGGAIAPSTRRFVAEWSTTVLDDPVAAVTGGVLDSEITTRERSLKGSSARLTSKAALDRWTGTPVSYEAMDYRWGTTRALLDDCVIGSADRPDPPSAEEAGDARA